MIIGLNPDDYSELKCILTQLPVLQSSEGRRNLLALCGVFDVVGDVPDLYGQTTTDAFLDSVLTKLATEEKSSLGGMPRLAILYFLEQVINQNESIWDESKVGFLNVVISQIDKKFKQQQERQLRDDLINFFDQLAISEAEWQKLFQTTCQTHRLNLPSQSNPDKIVGQLQGFPADCENHKQPLLTFLVGLKAKLTDATKRTLERQLSQWAELWGIDLDKVRAAVADQTTSTAATGYPERLLVIITSESEAKEPEQQDYELRVLHWRGPTKIAPWYDDKGAETFKLDQLAAQFDQVIRGRKVPPILEFFLPNELLDHEVDGWQLAGNSFQTYGKLHQVVVRPLERIKMITQYDQLRTLWEQRWDYFNRICAGGCVLPIKQKQGHTPQTLFSQLINPDAQVACLVLAFQPKIAPNQQEDDLTAMLSAGLPIALWFRQAEPTTAMIDCLKEVKGHSNLAELPEIVKAYRLKASDEEKTDLGYHLTLLWDNPHILPLEHLKDERYNHRLTAPS